MIKKFDLYETITNRIIEKMEQGKIPWRQPWKNRDCMPKNLVTKKAYQGINVFLLTMQGYTSPYWCTYNQAVQLGGNVKKGEKSSIIVYWNFVEKEEEKEDGTKKNVKIPFLRYFNVFNTDQCEGLEVPKVEETIKIDSIEICEKIVAGYKDCPTITNQLNKASYNRKDDVIKVPIKNDFNSAEEYYSTLHHEMIHSTGHEKRLNRFSKDEAIIFGDENYSFEELIAEFGGAFLCAEAGIDSITIENSAAYIQNWIAVLKNNNKWLVQASGKAKKASQYIMGTEEGENE